VQAPDTQDRPLARELALTVGLLILLGIVVLLIADLIGAINVLG
jgi:hypothetical protein